MRFTHTNITNILFSPCQGIKTFILIILNVLCGKLDYRLFSHRMKILVNLMIQNISSISNFKPSISSSSQNV